MKKFEGVPISPGYGMAPPHSVMLATIEAPQRSIDEKEIAHEHGRFLASVEQTRAELMALRRKTAEEIGEQEAEIFDAHILVLDDPILHYEVNRRLKSEKLNIEAVLESVINGIRLSFEGMQESVMRERSADVADVGQRLIRNLVGAVEDKVDVKKPSIIVAVDLSPSTAATLNPELVTGFVLETGSTTSHTAIIARALGIPAIVVKPDSLPEIIRSRFIIIDGVQGFVLTDPDEKTVEDYRRKNVELLQHEIVLRKKTSLAAATTDGLLVHVAANLEIPSEISVAREFDAHGVGLYRTEYLFMSRRHLPDEEEQYRHYRVVAEAFSEWPVIIRTIDIGGDKFLSETDVPQSMNPYLGLRAIRFSLRQPDLFRIQLRAIIRASRHGKVRVMFPMIACIEEVSAAMAMLAECEEDLGFEKNSIPVGIMVETPASALMAGTFARYLDFFSIGTNDLIQYTMAAERGNDELEYLNRPTHPAIIHIINQVILAARKSDIELSICGEMASDFQMIPVLLGLGITRLSTNPRVIPAVKEMVRRVSISECRELIGAISACEYSSDIAKIITERFGERSQDLAARR